MLFGTLTVADKELDRYIHSTLDRDPMELKILIIKFMA